LQKAEGQFQDIVMTQQAGQKADTNKATSLSQAVTFVSTMSTFMDTLKNITLQLPSIQNALKDKQANQVPLKQTLGADVNKFGQLIGNQFNKAGGGIMAKVGRLFKGGGWQDAQAVLKTYGIDGNTMANDILQMTPTELQKFTQESATTPTFELQTPTQPQNQATVPAAPAAQASPTQTAVEPVATQTSQPTQQSQATPGSPAPAPNTKQAQQRDVKLQGALKNRNAFNTQVLGQLDNNSIEADLKNIAKSLGIKL
jgi:hypothetical protein